MGKGPNGAVACATAHAETRTGACAAICVGVDLPRRAATQSSRSCSLTRCSTGKGPCAEVALETVAADAPAAAATCATV